MAMRKKVSAGSKAQKHLIMAAFQRKSGLWDIMSSEYDAVFQLVLNVYSIYLTEL